jgi:hypothetical protein
MIRHAIARRALEEQDARGGEDNGACSKEFARVLALILGEVCLGGNGEVGC